MYSGIDAQRAADAGAVTSGALAAVSWISQANEILTLFATITAIIAGVMAGLYHYEGWLRRRRERGK